MGIENTAKHLALVKAQLKKLKGSDEPGTFFIVFDRGSKGALLHVDLVASPARFKNPRVIRQRLQKAKKLDPAAYEPFFKGKGLVSVSGPIRYADDGSTVLIERSVGKGNAGDIKAALRFFRFIKKYELAGGDDAPTDDEPPIVASEKLSAAKALLGTDTPSPDEVASRLYAGGGSVDDLLSLIADLEEALEGGDLDDETRAALAESLAALVTARDALDAWLDPDEGGPLGLAAGFSELVSQADLDEAAQEVIDDHLREARGAWEASMGEVRGALAELAGATAEAASGLEESQDPGGLAALASVDGLTALLLQDMPQSVRTLLDSGGEQIHLNAAAVDTVLVDLGAHRAAMPSPLVQITDEHLKLGIGDRLDAALGALADTFQRLRARIL